MKEISIEQKAKRYDEALERARELSTSISGAQYDTIFPELKEESEDERIRKALMQNLKERFGTKGNMGEGLDMPDVLAWLEKKCEPIDKIVKRATTEKQRVLLTETNGDANIDWDTRSLQDVKLLLEYGLDYIKKLEKQGEQILANSAKTCKDEQKPAWSEEDEQYLLVCKNALAKYQVSDKWDANIISRWLENRLKSLKERYTWKPSDEQIKALNYAVNLMASSESPKENDYYYNVFKDLREQLKNLKR